MHERGSGRLTFCGRGKRKKKRDIIICWFIRRSSEQASQLASVDGGSLAAADFTGSWGRENNNNNNNNPRSPLAPILQHVRLFGHSSSPLKQKRKTRAQKCARKQSCSNNGYSGHVRTVDMYLTYMSVILSAVFRSETLFLFLRMCIVSTVFVPGQKGNPFNFRNCTNPSWNKKG